MRPPLSLLLLAALMIAPGRAQAQGAQRLSLAEAVELSLRRGPEIDIARQGVVAAETRVSGASAQRFPRLRAEAGIQRWDEPLELTFAPMGAMPPDMMAPGSAGALTVREQVTSTITVSVVQPISGLFVLNRLVAIERSGAEAARADIGRARLDTAQRAAEAYLRLLQAKAFLAVTSKSLEQVEAQLARAQSLEKAGALAAVDVLRLTSARDSARQNVLRAQGGVAVARSGLVLALDLPADTLIETVDDLPDPPPPVRWTDAAAPEAALANRPELRGATERTAQARGASGVAMAQLFPNILAIGTYQHAEGNGPFMPRDAWFIGASLAWDIWDWGKNWNAVKEARARATQAQIGERVQRDQVAFDARRRLVEARTAFETLAPARTALTAAEEAYRIQSVRFAEGAATTTDVIDAEADLSRARLSYTQARYDYYLAQAALARAVGEMPAGVPGGDHANRR